MAHLIDTMAYRTNTATPWHGLGNTIDGDDIDAWAQAAGLVWRINSAPVEFTRPGADGTSHSDTVPGQRVLYRSDTAAPLAVVSDRFKVVQPSEVLDFFKGVVGHAGYRMDTAGSLAGGRKIWALARTGQDAEVVPGDAIKGYLLLATACDGSMSTTATFTSVRVVCNNTLTLAAGRADGAVRIPHNRVFNAPDVRRILGVEAVGPQWDSFIGRMRKLADKDVSINDASDVVHEVFGVDADASSHATRHVLALFRGRGMGAGLEGVRGTAWGLLNAITEYADHHAVQRSAGGRLDSAWFGTNAARKDRATSILETI